MVLCMVSIMVRCVLHGRDHRRELRYQLRHERIHLIEVFDEIVQFIAKARRHRRVHLEYGSQRPADRNIVAVLFPVEVAANRPVEILEIRNVIPQLFGDRRRRHFVSPIM